MAGISSINAGANATSNVELDVAYQAAAVKKQVQVARDIGNAALTLIQSAVVDPNVGQNLDVLA